MRQIFAILTATLAAMAATNRLDAGPAPADPRSHARELLARLPLRFEANQGQTDARVKFVARGSGYTLFLTANEAVLARGTDVVRLSFRGASARARLVPLEQLPGETNVLVGSDPSRWRMGIAGYGKVKYEEIYPGIDLVFYGNDRQLEYDLIVRAGAHPGRIRFTLDGTRELNVDDQGDLVARTGAGEIRLRRPTIYQAAADLSATRAIEGRYRVEGHTVSFDVGRYDRAKPLVIDPVLVYQTYLGGNGSDNPGKIAVDANGFTYVTGVTDSSDFPTTPGAFLPTASISHSATIDGREPCVVSGPVGPGFGANAFVAKLSPDGSSLVYATYLGGTYTIDDHICRGPQDAARSIAVDASGNAYVTGYSGSGDFPRTSGTVGTAPPESPLYVAGDRMFVAKLDPTGSSLIYSARFGSMVSAAIAVDNTGSAYVTGGRADGSFPVTPGAFQQYCGGIPVFGCIPSVFEQGFDAFVLKLDPAASVLSYATFLGGLGLDGGAGIAVDGAGQATVTGGTRSQDFPTTPGATFPPDFPNGQPDNVFVSRLNADGSGLIFSTYLGGDAIELAGSIALDAGGYAYVTGSTTSNNFPTTSGAFQPIFPPSPGQGVSRAFVTKLAPDGTLLYSTYLGGSGSDNGYGIAVDSAGRAYVVGATDSADFPSVDPVQGSRCGCQQAFASVFDPSGSSLVFSSYVGGGIAQSVAVAPDGGAYIVGVSGPDLQTVNPIQPVAGGGGDLFISKIALTNIPQISWPAPVPIAYGTPLDAGQLHATAGIAGTFVYDPPPGTVLHAGTGQTLSVTFTPADPRFATVLASVSLDVERGLLTVTADAAAKAFGAPLPVLSSTYSGFVNGDTPSSLTGTLMFSTTATPTSPVGPYSIVPSGLSSADYDITFGPGTLTILPATTAAVLVGLPSSVGVLQPVVLIAGAGAVAPGVGVPDGTIQFMDGTTILGTSLMTGGAASLVVNGLSSGVHSLTAVYSGSGNFLGSTSAPVAVTVRSTAASTFTVLVLSNNPSAAGQPAIVSAVVLPLAGGAAPTGLVQFFDSSTPLATVALTNGVATLSTSSLGVGLHYLTARYSGSASFAASAAPGAFQTVYTGPRPKTTSIALAVSANPSPLGQPVIVTATVTPSGIGAPTGIVVLTADGFVVGAGNVSNVGGIYKADVSMPALSLGTHVITALYTGDGAFTASNSPPGFQVVQ